MKLKSGGSLGKIIVPHFCPGGRWFDGAEEAVNTLVSDNCEGRQTAKYCFRTHQNTYKNVLKRPRTFESGGSFSLTAANAFREFCNEFLKRHN